MYLLDDDVDEAPSWLIPYSVHAALLRGTAFWELLGHS